jgi:hypothetical protein
MAHPTMLGKDYELQVCDVLCGIRGSGKAFRHTGNARLRVMVDLHLSAYRQAGNKKAKTAIIKVIIHGIRESGGRFVACHHGVWYEVGDQRAQDKGMCIYPSCKLCNDPWMILQQYLTHASSFYQSVIP